MNGGKIREIFNNTFTFVTNDKWMFMINIEDIITTKIEEFIKTL
jgi:hypothetical protein